MIPYLRGGTEGNLSREGGSSSSSDSGGGSKRCMAFLELVHTSEVGVDLM